jgi:peroxiredoxin
VRALDDDGALRPMGSRILGALMLAGIGLALLGVAVKVVGSALGPRAPRVGEPAPAFTLPALDGSRVSLDALKGEVVVLDFWATWCSGCVAFAPAAKRLQAAYADRRVTWLKVHVPPLDAGEVERFLAARGASFPVALDAEGEVAARYGLYGTPTYVIIDRGGRIRALHHRMAAEAQLARDLDRVLAEDPATGASR